MLFVIDLLRFASRTPHTHSLGRHSKSFKPAANGMKHTESRNYRTGSRIQVPSSWTDHPVGQVPMQRIRPGGRATPDALRDLISLLRTLVAPARTPHAWTHVPSKGGQHEQATPSVRATVSNLGPPDLAPDGSRQTPPDPLDDCRDGESFPPPKGADAKGGN